MRVDIYVGVRGKESARSLAFNPKGARSLGVRRRKRRGGERQEREGERGGAGVYWCLGREAVEQQISRAYLLLTCFLFPLDRAGGSM